MTTESRPERRTRRFCTRRIGAAVVTVAVGVATAAAPVRPAAAAAPWLTVSDGFASFAVPADDIRDTMGNVTAVVVEGNFGPSFNLSELGLVRSGDAWTSRIGPLPAGLYHYRLRGDDTKIVKDATNPTAVTSEPTWSTFLVPGDSARLIADVPPGRGGALQTIAYPGGSATVWTPPGYDADRRRPYPVLYLQPGEGGGHADWTELGRAGQILDNLSIQRLMEPMVVVMGDRTDVPALPLVRTVHSRFHVARDGGHRAIAGASAGGASAVRTALTRPGEFAWAGSFGGVVPGGGPRVNAEAVNTSTRLLRLYTGNRTDPAYNPTYRLLLALGKAHVRHEFDGVNPDAGHNWKAWQENLADFVPRLFRAAPGHGPSAGHPPLRHEFTPPAPGTTPTPWLSREANGDTFVTVETGTEFAGAQHVTLWGNWAPGGSWVNVPLTRAGDRWRVTVGPLKPWFYYYKFIVDRVSHKDTSNPSSVTTEPTWSTFLVPGKRARLLADVPAGRGGALERLTYRSTVAAEDREAYVWTPPGYDPARPAQYPVLYLQHGSGQNYTDWVEMGRARQILDNHFRDGALVPMVVVMANGNVPDLSRELLEGIVPAARARYHISHEPHRQALAGLSMGGFQTLDVVRSRPGEFAWIGTFSAGVFGEPTGYDATAINEGTRLLRVYTGNVTDFTYPITMATLDAFDRLGIRYEFAGITPGPHGWDTWQKNLIDFAPRLFRSGDS
ncbi:alpha/beta hydrolase-fold protein [Actinoplanes aureus]|uniref:Esterase n=1 Tax=Actinoplanes aureus TaxID=2792083 RepID=A0A931CIP8_9ACTN|nr:alpha/beta hydrolase-fold protein [Actinoplanes aureus]MBG0568058.1 esterase [Actinoplanes aureus]